MKNVTIYSIPNCDVTKKVFTWLKENKIAYNFHDYKKEGITVTKLNEWSKKSSWEKLLNKRGTTWKGISPAIQETINNQKAAAQLMQEHTSLIKRPVIEVNDKILIGFDETIYKDVLLTDN
ncbi:MAG: Spx/MgsR family RNA polymerase-binding regulatory protein [Ferruginibacter sp.]